MKRKVTFLMIFCLIMLNFNSVYALTLTNDDSKTYLRSKEEVISKYDESLIGFNNFYDLYVVEPDIENEIEGILNEDIQNMTLKQINYYRWQYGVSNVYLQSENNYRNQRCAVVLGTINKLTHYPKEEYAYLLTGFSDKFVNDAEEGCGGGNGYSGNASKGGSLYSSVKEYVSEINNINEGVGHRYSILDPNAYGTSMGYYNSYGSISMYLSSNVNNYDYYAWPAAGYNPSEILSPDEQWSIKFNPIKYSISKNTKVQVEYNGVYEYANYIINNHYNALSFTLPYNIKNQITTATGKFVTPSLLNVTVTNLKGAATDLQYTVKIVNKNEDNYENFDFWYKKVDIQTYARSSKQIDGKKYYIFDGNYDYNLKIMLDGKNANFDINVANSNIAKYDKTENKLYFYENGFTNLIVKDKTSNKEFNIYINSVSIDNEKNKNIQNTYVNIENMKNNYTLNNTNYSLPPSIKDENNLSIYNGNIINDFNHDNVIDEADVKLLLLEIYKNEKKYDIFDINNDGKINILDVQELTSNIK